MADRDSVLVTGAYGLVGRPVVDRLVADGHHVVATAHHATKPALPASVDVRSVDLTKPDQVTALLGDVSPSAIVHLAAYLPPHCYANRALARAVNVGATASLVRAAEKMPSPPRFVHASSMAVYGSRNPHRLPDLLTPETPPLASELYGCHKLAAENIVRASALEWSILRLGASSLSNRSLTTAISTPSTSARSCPRTTGAMPSTSVMCRGVLAAITTDAVREIFMIAGDDSHKNRTARWRSQAPRRSERLHCCFRPPGDPDSDTDWFPLDWMDTAAGAVLSAVLEFRVVRGDPGEGG